MSNILFAHGSTEINAREQAIVDALANAGHTVTIDYYRDVNNAVLGTVDALFFFHAYEPNFPADWATTTKPIITCDAQSFPHWGLAEAKTSSLYIEEINVIDNSTGFTDGFGITTTPHLLRVFPESPTAEVVIAGLLNVGDGFVGVADSGTAGEWAAGYWPQGAAGFTGTAPGYRGYVGYEEVVDETEITAEGYQLPVNAVNTAVGVPAPVVNEGWESPQLKDSDGQLLAEGTTVEIEVRSADESTVTLARTSLTVDAESKISIADGLGTEGDSIHIQMWYGTSSVFDTSVVGGA